MNVYINKTANEALGVACSIMNDMIEKFDNQTAEEIDELRKYSSELNKLYLKSVK